MSLDSDILTLLNKIINKVLCQVLKSKQIFFLFNQVSNCVKTPVFYQFSIL